MLKFQPQTIIFEFFIANGNNKIKSADDQQKTKEIAKITTKPLD